MMFWGGVGYSMSYPAVRADAGGTQDVDPAARPGHDVACCTAAAMRRASNTVGSLKNELIRRQGPWRDINHVEFGTAQWVALLNTERPHENLDDLAPQTVENLHYARQHALPEA